MVSGLIEYLDSIRARDPAPRSRWEILLYPGLWAVALHRAAHWLFEGRMFFLARLVNHFARFLTGIDIHPGATIGRHLFIDHGFTVIGETAQIGDNVTIYQCVTLGGTNPANGVAGKRHPTLADGVIVGSGAQILGPITVGAGARVGANAVVTEDVAPGTTMVGWKARPTHVPMDAWLRDFMPYGTPCQEPCPELPGPEALGPEALGPDPSGAADAARVAALEAEVAALKAQVAGLLAQQAVTP